MDKTERQNLMTIAQFARHLGVSYNAVKKATLEGRIYNSVIVKGKKKYLKPDLAKVEWQENTCPGRCSIF